MTNLILSTTVELFMLIPLPQRLQPPEEIDDLDVTKPPTTIPPSMYGEHSYHLCTTNYFEAPANFTEAASLYLRLLPFVRH